MDIPDVCCVVSYDMPKYIKGYIHRAGRSGRAGQPGLAVTMVTHTQVGIFQQMLQTAGKQGNVTELIVDEEELKLLEEPYKEALKELKTLTQESVAYTCAGRGRGGGRDRLCPLPPATQQPHRHANLNHRGEQEKQLQKTKSLKRVTSSKLMSRKRKKKNNGNTSSSKKIKT
ncbi:ATP-dependent RNA helicase ddx51 [Homalodisca vitripennis]|nr:ATP-dependent RNA helicase ddx51 [Homalodisca vitripennis]